MAGDDKPRKPEIDESEARELLKRERASAEAGLAERSRQRGSELGELETEQSGDDRAETFVEEETDEALARSLRSKLDAIERAEERLEKGTYGLSVESGEPIPAERLRSKPWAERTIEEQERFERTRGPGA